jgi:hypothetical protein
MINLYALKLSQTYCLCVQSHHQYIFSYQCTCPCSMLTVCFELQLGNFCVVPNVWFNISVFFSGLHVVVIMFTGYLVGFAMFKALFNNSPVLVSPSEHCIWCQIIILQPYSVPLVLWTIPHTSCCGFSECCWRYLRSSRWHAGGDHPFHHQIIK